MSEQEFLYSSFNARALEPAEVAKTFVPPPDFIRLAETSHCFLVGPRGSGKTTLLKMLQQPAIESWKHSMASQFRKTVAFTGAYVPTDVTFKSQLELLSTNKEVSDHLIRGAYALHITRAVLQAIRYRVSSGFVGPGADGEASVAWNRAIESEFIEELCCVAQLSTRLPSIRSMMASISARLLDLFELARSIRSQPISIQLEKLRDAGVMRLDVIKLPAIAIELFEAHAGIVAGKWALLLDELELAPSLIVEEFTRLVRSTDERFIFKLSLSPFTGGTERVDGTTAPPSAIRSPTDYAEATCDGVPPAQEHHDFVIVRLWHAHKMAGLQFSNELAQSVMEAKGIVSGTLRSLLGRSQFDRPSHSRATRGEVYRPGSANNRRLCRLSEIDPSFQDYLSEKQIDLSRPIASDDMRAKTLRKINGLVIVREAFRSRTGQRRARKNPTLYTGASAFLSICESNPRWIIGIMNQLLANVSVNFERRAEPIPAPVQAEVFTSACARFRAYLRTIPLSVDTFKGRRGLLSILDCIGEFFHSQVVVSRFSPDPYTSFRIDSHSSPELIDALERALNAGAIVWVPEDPHVGLLSSLRGKRFRLSYLLASYYQTPLQLGRAISLDHIVRKQVTSKRLGGPTLFDNTED